MIFVALLVFCVVNTNGSKEGDSCTKNGIAGVCTNINQCPDAKQDIKNKIKPHICEFFSVPIVCCVSSTPTTTTTTTERPQNGNCVLPPYPDHGTYTANVCNDKPCDFIILNITCNQGYGVVEGRKTIFCHNGWWPDPMPECTPACRMPSDPEVKYNCLVSESDVNSTRACKEYEPHGAIVNPSCKSNTAYSPTPLKIMHCIDGAWDYVPTCVTDCGTVIQDEPGEMSVRHGDMPWHAGIYAKNKQPYPSFFCGGTMVTPYYTITAAHCFWDEGKGQQLEEDFLVAVGKLYRKWEEPRDLKTAQFSDVSKINLAYRFQGGRANYQDDIAVIKTSEPFIYTTYVRPVCMDFGIEFDWRQLQPGNKGKVSGWGLTGKNGELSELLKVMEVPYVRTDTCISDWPKHFRPFLTSDKFCAGFNDGSSKLCKGDSGGGLVFPNVSNGTQQYYLRGLMSVAPVNENPCNTKTYVGFTHVQKHEQFIKELLNIFTSNYTNQNPT